MKISRKSWHYRLLKFLHIETPHSICGYFWGVVFSVFWVTIIGIVLICVSPIWAPVLLAVWLCDKYNIGKGSHKPWLVVEWAKAKKNKVCPLIELED